MIKTKVAFLVVVAVILVLAIVFGIAWSIFGAQLVATTTIEKLDDGLYVMSYVGDYGFDGYLEQGGGSSAKEMAAYIMSFLSGGFYNPGGNESQEAEIGCSTITVKDSDGNMIFGRNYDWQPCRAMIVHTKPENGYESVSTSCIDFLGFGEEWEPDTSMGNRFMALAAVYVPLDGMNEKGLCIADLMAGDKVETHQNLGKIDLTTTAAIRLILDKAATVDEAIELLKEIDIHSDIGSAHHFAISDVTGKSVVIEYVDNEMYVTETVSVTNHYLSEVDKKGTGSEQSHIRYNKLIELYSVSGGIMTQEEVKNALSVVSQSNFETSNSVTVWSIVFVPETQTAMFYYKEDFTNPYVIKISDFEIDKENK